MSQDISHQVMHFSDPVGVFLVNDFSRGVYFSAFDAGIIGTDVFGDTG